MAGGAESNVTGFADLLHFFNCRLQIFARVKFFRIFGKQFADGTGDGHTAVGVNIDFAHAGFDAADDFFDRNAESLRDGAALSVDQILQFLRNRRGTVHNHMGIRQFGMNFFNNVNCQNVTGRLAGKFISAVRSADGNRQRVQFGFGDKTGGFVRFQASR